MRASVVVACVVWFGSTSRLEAQSTIHFKSRELQEGRNYIDKLSPLLAVGESTGQVTYSFPIEVPPGRGVTPVIALEYSSSGGLSEYGWGWELTIPTIERSDRFGAPMTPPAQSLVLFRYRNGHQVAELESAGLWPGGWTEYRERSERTYNRYLFDGSRWRILTPTGTMFELGTTKDSRRGTDPNTLAGTSVWMVDKIRDTHRNYARYTYQPGRSGNARIFAIEYGGNDNTGLSPGLRVEFSWGFHFYPSTSPPLSFRNGYQQTFLLDRLNRIVVTAPSHATAGNPAVIPPGAPTTRTYTFAYSPIAPAGGDRVFHLTSAQVGSFPATTFTYGTTVASGTTVGQAQDVLAPSPGTSAFPKDLGESATRSITASLSETLTHRVFADVNRDARPDLLDSSGCGSYIAWINTGTGFTRQTWGEVTTVPGDPLPDKCALRTSSSSSTGVGGATEVTQDFLDLDGDGFPDLVYISGPGVRYCPGNGHGFDACKLYSPVSPHAGAYLRKDEQYGSTLTRTVNDLIDMNGDGLVDAVSLSAQTLFVRLNGQGTSGFASEALPSTAPACGYPALQSCLRVTEVVNGSPNRRMWADVRDINGDGLPDFLTIDPTAPNQVYAAWGRTAPDGVGFGSLEQLILGPRSIGLGQQSGANYAAREDLVDINGDGLPDWVSFPGSFPAIMTVHVNLGGGAFDKENPRTYTLAADVFPPLVVFHGPELSRVVEATPPQGFQSATTTLAQLADLNGDGFPDFVSAQMQTTLPSSMLFARRLDYQPGRRLVSVSSLNGKTSMTVSYGAENGTSPHPVHVARAVTRTRAALYAGEPSRHTSTTTAYRYGSMNFEDRVFTGFGAVMATGPAFAATTVTDYETSRFMPGLVQRRLQMNNAARSSTEEVRNTYELREHGPNRFEPQLVETRSYTGIGGLEHRTHYFGISPFGKPTQWTEYGDPSTSNDDVNHVRTYATRQDEDRILDLLSTETASNPVDGSLSTTRYYYDALPLGAAPTKGDLTTLERERELGVFTTKTYSHDIYGNVTQELDELGTATTYGYDPTYHQYRTSITTPVGTVYRSYNALTGLPADECGPQSSGSSFRCSRTEVDNLGRTTATYAPTLSATAYGKALLASVAYDDNAYPLSTTITKRGLSRTIEYRDGFGNPCELRVEETTNSFRVFETAFDAYDRPLRVEQPRREAGTAYAHAPVGAEAWVYTHDYVRNDIETVTHPRDAGDPSPAATASYVVDFFGNANAVDEDGRTTSYVFDRFRRVAFVDRSGPGGATASTRFAYRSDGQLVGFTDPNDLTTTYRRNLLGWPVSITTPDGAVTTRAYNDRGQEATSVDPRGVIVTRTYDVSGRLTSILSANEPAGVRRVDATYTYYDATVPAQLGWLRTEASDDIIYEYRYTPEGALATHRVAYGSNLGTVSLLYELGARLRAVIYPDGFRADYAYNLDDSIRTVTNGRTVLASYLYEDDGQPSAVTNDHGLDESYTYDARGRRTALISTNTQVTAGTLVEDYLTLSKASLVTKLERRGLAPGLVPRLSPEVLTMTIDTLGRLQSVDRDGAQFAKYAYDLGDRIVNFNEQSVDTNTVYSADKIQSRFDLVTHGQLVSHTFQYDAAGNVTQDKRADLTHNVSRERRHRWDALGRYSRTETVGGGNTEYYYTSSGALSRVVHPGEAPTTADTIHMGQWCRKDITTGQWTNTVLAGGTAIGESTDGRFEMPHRTLQQTVAAVSNDQGEVIRQEEFRPYGARLSGSGSGRFEQHFHGLRTDQLTVIGGRAYASETGSWLGRDPLPLTSPANVMMSSRLSNMYGIDFGNTYVWRDSNGMNPQQEFERRIAQVRYATQARSLSGGEQHNAIMTVMNDASERDNLEQLLWSAAAVLGAWYVLEIGLAETPAIFMSEEASAAAIAASASAEATAGLGAGIGAAGAAGAAEIRAASMQPRGGGGIVLRDGAGATPAELAASRGGPTGGSRAGQATIRQELIREHQSTGQPFVCWRCGQTATNPADMHLGHRNVPTSAGGNLSRANVCLEGAACNLSTGNRGSPSPGMSCAARGSCGAPYGR